MTTTLIDFEQHVRDLPADLRQRTGERALIKLALAAVETVSVRLPRWSGTAEGRFSPQMLLTLLTYCYAAGVYGSEDIEWDCRNDAAARYICANACPDSDTIRRFRRANRPWIEECLAWMYGEVCGVPSAEMSLEPVRVADCQREPHPELASFVQRKLQLAILIDTAMCD